MGFGASGIGLCAGGGGRAGVVDAGWVTLNDVGGGSRFGGVGASMGVRMDEVGIGASGPGPTAGAEAVSDTAEALLVIENVAFPVSDALGKRIVNGVRTRG